MRSTNISEKFRRHNIARFAPRAPCGNLACITVMITHCIIHFGLAKTGTTSIQQFLSNGLSDPRFYYPPFGKQQRLGDDCHNRALTAAFHSDPSQQHDYAKENLPLDVIQARGSLFRELLKKEVATSSARTLLLSAEDTSWFETEEVVHLVDFLRNLGLDCEAIAYVKTLKDDLESKFEQGLKEPGARHLEKPVPLDRTYPFYQRRVENFDKVLGTTRVRLLRFDRQKFKEGCVVRDFCNTLGIHPPASAPSRANEGLSLDAVKLLYCYRLLGPGYGAGRGAMQSNRNLITKFREMSGPRFAFHSSLLTRREKLWRGDLNWISDRMGTDMLGNLHADDEGPCLRSENELLTFSQDALAWLAGESGMSEQKLRAGDPQVVADAVGMLRQKSFSPGTAWRRGLQRLTALLSDSQPKAT